MFLKEINEFHYSNSEKLGDAFDVTADKKQTNFKKSTAIGKYKQAYTASFEIVLKTINGY